MPTPLVVLLLFLLLVAATTLWLYRLHTTPADTLRNLLSLLRNQSLRRNHAIEHATVNVIEERHGPTSLVGHATSEGFRIAGPVEPLELLDAAQEALRRLQRGERRLAIHNRCGPSYLAALMVVGCTTLVFMLASRRFTSLDAPMVLALMLVLAPGLSRLLQRWATTAIDVQGVAIEGIGPVSQGLRDNRYIYDLLVRVRPLRRSLTPRYRYGELAPAYARTNPNKARFAL